MKILTLSAQQILDATTPEELFTFKGFSKEFSKLRSKWHPDRNLHPRSNQVFTQIGILAEQAKTKITNNTWATDSEITFTSKANKTFRFKYRSMHKIEVGQMYIGLNAIVFVFEEGFKDLFDNGIERIKAIKYPNDKIKNEFSKLMPVIKFSDNETTIGPVAVFEKPKGSVLLQNLIDYHTDKKIDPKHIAWIGGCLMNISVFLDRTDICHNSITTTSVFIDTANHAVFLIGGWWYATKADTKLKAIPAELLKILPKTMFDDKMSKTEYDRLAIKGVILGCMGDPTLVGSKLLKDKDLPKLMLTWARSPSSSGSLEDYRGWTKVVEQSFGVRKFIEYEKLTNVY